LLRDDGGELTAESWQLIAAFGYFCSIPLVANGNLVSESVNP